MERKQQFIANTFLLTVVTLFLRTVGVSFHVYIANRIGAAGMGLFSLIMSVYNFGVTFACSGINLAATKVVSEELALGKEGGLRRAILSSCCYAALFGGTAFLLIFFSADFIGPVFLNDARTVLPLKILSVSLPCVALSSAISGYFSAVGRVYKSALVQILEQLIRVLGCVLLFRLLNDNDTQSACCYVVASGSAAEVISFLLLCVMCLVDIKRYRKNRAGDQVTKRVLWIAIPIAVSSYVRSALSCVEHTMIPRGLKKHGGNAQTALASYGVIHGMVMPLIFFPSAVLQAFSTLLIPEVSIYQKQGRHDKISALIEKALYTTLVFSIGASGILYFFADEIGMAVYKSQDVARFLKMIAPLAALMYADGVVDAVLKGLNQQVYSMAYNILDSVLAIVLMIFLLPLQGVFGYLIIIYATEMVNAFFSINRLLKVAEFRIRPLFWTVIPTVAICAVSYFIRCFLPVAFSISKTVFAIAAVVSSYAAIMLIFSGGIRIKTVVAKCLGL